MSNATNPQSGQAPPLAAFLAYLVVGFVALLLPEYSYNEQQVIQGAHVSDPFIWSIVLLLFLWSAVTLWWLKGFQRMSASGCSNLPGEWVGQAATGVFLVGALACWCKPFLSSDPFYYVAYGRQFAVLGLNPYEQNLYASVSDPIIGQVDKTWFQNVAFYGPVALALYAIPNLILGQSSLMELVVFLKFLWLFFYLGVGWLALKYWAALPDRLARTVTVLASPVLLWYGLVDGHVDLLILFFLLLTASLMKAGKAVPSALSLAAAASIKIVGIVSLPVCFFWWLNRSKKGAAVFSATFLVVYGGIYFALKGGEYPRVVEFTKLWNNLEAANLVPRLLGHTSLELTQVQLLSNLLFYGTVLAVSLLTWRGVFGSDPALPMAWVMAALFLTRTYFQPWYTLWFWPLLWFSDVDGRTFRGQFYLWTVTVLSAWLIPWEYKGYFVGLSSLVALILATRNRDAFKRTEPAGYA